MKHCKGKNRITLLLIAVLMLCLITTGSFAWYDHSRADIPEVGGSVSFMAKYFESGDGTEATPYEIKTPDQLYNLAWLQFMGYFDDRVTHFYLSSDLDMAGYKLPPIGTTSHPFIGEFNGNKKMISNLWVTSVEEDWFEPPQYVVDDVGTDIGFFGRLGDDALTNTYGKAYEFYLSDYTCTSDVGGNVGLIAGYVAGNLHSIGVNNSRIELVNESGSGLDFNSDYSLLGKTQAGIEWEDRPGSEGNGDLIINPTFIESPYNRNITTGQNIELSMAANLPDGTKSARLIGNLAYSLQSPDPQLGISILRNVTNYQFGQTYTITKSNSVTTTNVEPELMETYNYMYPKYRYKPSAAPGFTGAYPTNCVWFKPLSEGKCTIAFIAENMSSDGAMSIYKFRVNTSANGTRSIDRTSVQEMKFVFSKGDKIGNGAIVYFNFDVPFEEGYEYCIGKDSNNTGTNVGFLFLKLAGTDVDPGGGTGPTKNIARVDFMEEVSEGSSPAEFTKDIWDSDYVVHNAVISLGGETGSTPPGGMTQTIDYDALSSDNKVHVEATPGVDVNVTGAAVKTEVAAASFALRGPMRSPAYGAYSYYEDEIYDEILINSGAAFASADTADLGTDILGYALERTTNVYLGAFELNQEDTPGALTYSAGRSDDDLGLSKNNLRFYVQYGEDMEETGMITVNFTADTDEDVVGFMNGLGQFVPFSELDGITVMEKLENNYEASFPATLYNLNLISYARLDEEANLLTGVHAAVESEGGNNVSDIAPGPEASVETVPDNNMETEPAGDPENVNEPSSAESAEVTEQEATEVQETEETGTEEVAQASLLSEPETTAPEVTEETTPAEPETTEAEISEEATTAEPETTVPEPETVQGEVSGDTSDTNQESNDDDRISYEYDNDEPAAIYLIVPVCIKGKAKLNAIDITVIDRCGGWVSVYLGSMDRREPDMTFNYRQPDYDYTELILSADEGFVQLCTDRVDTIWVSSADGIGYDVY
ncbi:MAG: hypothetical protein Q4B67_00025 [Eubacteriales bacterium]|nr:hypothetical protein [Eubacteriales bacterium]